MDDIQVFERSMIERALKELEMEYDIDDDGDCHIPFGYQSEIRAVLDMWAMPAGETGSVFSFLAIANRPFPRRDWAHCLMVCNLWNREYRWPKAYLSVTEEDGDYGAIWLDYHVDLRRGVYQAQVADWIADLCGGAIRFWKWAVAEHNI